MTNSDYAKMVCDSIFGDLKERIIKRELLENFIIAAREDAERGAEARGYAKANKRETPEYDTELLARGF